MDTIIKYIDLIENWKVIDISTSCYPNMPSYPGDPKFKITGPYSVLPTDKVREYCYEITMSTQTGTHIQAPHYFLENGQKIDQFPLTTFRMIAVVIDLSQDFTDTISRINELHKKYDLNNKAVIFRTGYQDRFEPCGKSPVESDSIKHPSISLKVARELCDLKIALVGIDAIGFEPETSQQFEVNLLFCEKGVLILEGLINLNLITGDIFLIEAYPLKILNVEGTPCRAVAIVAE
ncbi:cyclase family protein [Candidatus Zixiibacteriota bacterium]